MATSTVEKPKKGESQAAKLMRLEEYIRTTNDRRKFYSTLESSKGKDERMPLLWSAIENRSLATGVDGNITPELKKLVLESKNDTALWKALARLGFPDAERAEFIEKSNDAEAKYYAATGPGAGPTTWETVLRVWGKYKENNTAKIAVLIRKSKDELERLKFETEANEYVKEAAEILQDIKPIFGVFQPPKIVTVANPYYAGTSLAEGELRETQEHLSDKWYMLNLAAIYYFEKYLQYSANGFEVKVVKTELVRDEANKVLTRSAADYKEAQTLVLQFVVKMAFANFVSVLSEMDTTDLSTKDVMARFIPSDFMPSKIVEDKSSLELWKGYAGMVLNAFDTIKDDTFITDTMRRASEDIRQLSVTAYMFDVMLLLSLGDDQNPWSSKNIKLAINCLLEEGYDAIKMQKEEPRQKLDDALFRWTNYFYGNVPTDSSR